MKLNLGCGKDIMEGYQNLDREEIDLEKPLPFENNSVDRIVLKEVVEHIRNHKQLLRECLRVLKPNTGLYLTTPNYRGLGCRLALLCGKTFFLRDLNHVRFFSDKIIVEELEEAGFVDIRVRGCSLTLGFLPACLSGNVQASAKKKAEKRE